MKQAELDALQMDRKFGLEELRRRHVTDLTLEEAEEKKTRAAAVLKELRQSIEAVSVRLGEEGSLSLKRAELMELVERQRMECRRWESLHDLISSEGQKGGDAAQELVFEMIVRDADKRLQKMTRRYSLMKDEDNPLSLSVIDNDQGELRLAKNAKDLSGGEGFIVSLAMALGFSKQVTRKAGVESLFLDDELDSLGKLDKEGLDMALSALAGLGREGKLIGIVSPAEALKERITARIEVVPQEDGRSVIKAPGCVGNFDFNSIQA
jgi:exonuclease SbcC